MPPLPVVSGDQARKALERDGWSFDRQRGSHMILKKPDHVLSLVIPRHRTLKPGMLRSLIRDAGLTVDEFVQLLEK